MTSVKKTFCIYHQLHQPYRVNFVKEHDKADYSDFFVGPNPGKRGKDYANETIFNQVAENSYIPATEYWLNLIHDFRELNITLSLSGTFLEQALSYRRFGEKVISNLKKLVDTGRVELLGETYYHSLSFLYDIQEYLEQIQKHRNVIQELFDYEPISFRNTELIYHKHLAEIIRQLGYRTIVASKVYDKMDDRGLSGGIASKFQLTADETELIARYRIAKPQDNISVLLNETTVSRGLFIMSDVEEAKDVILNSEMKLINFFTDFEIYGEHNKDKNNGLLQVMRDIIKSSIDSGMLLNTVTEAGKRFREGEYSSDEYTTWANSFHDLRTWVGQDNQNKAHRKMMVLLTLIKNLEPSKTQEYDSILEMWRKLSTSDHFYYMPVYDTEHENWSLDLFSPYESAQQAYDIFIEACDYLTRRIIQANLSASKLTLPIAHHSHNIYH